MKLIRTDFNKDGIFGILTDDNDVQVAVTLEHSYEQADGSFLPKIPLSGEFLCERGPHRLHNMTSDFITFEITGVEGHSNILFHWGNYNKDSEGCVLLGKNKIDNMITNSRDTFKKFIDSLDGIDSFTLTVS